MIVEYIRYRVEEGTAGAFEGAYASARTALDASAHCLGYELSRCVEEPSHSVLRIGWDSLPGHLEGFRRSPEFGAFSRNVRPFVGNIGEMRHHEVTAIRRRADEGPATSRESEDQAGRRGTEPGFSGVPAAGASPRRDRVTGP